MAHVAHDYGWQSSAYPRSQTHVHDKIIEILGSDLPCSVLDLGCGNGFLAGRLAKMGCKVTAVDADERGIRLGQESYPEVRFVRCDIANASPGELGGPFRCVIASEVIEHLFDPASLIRLSTKVLETQGVLVLATPYHGYAKNLLLSLVDGWDNHHEPLVCGGHIKFWSLATITQLLRAEGMRVRRWGGTGRAPLLWKSLVVLAESGETAP
jgi:SAM-dependent methyltransferase